MNWGRKLIMGGVLGTALWAGYQLGNGDKLLKKAEIAVLEAMLNRNVPADARPEDADKDGTPNTFVDYVVSLQKLKAKKYTNAKQDFLNHVFTMRDSTPMTGAELIAEVWDCRDDAGWYYPGHSGQPTAAECRNAVLNVEGPDDQTYTLSLDNFVTQFTQGTLPVDSTVYVKRKDCPTKVCPAPSETKDCPTPDYSAPVCPTPSEGSPNNRDDEQLEPRYTAEECMDLGIDVTGKPVGRKLSGELDYGSTPGVTCRTLQRDEFQRRSKGEESGERYLSSQQGQQAPQSKPLDLEAVCAGRIAEAAKKARWGYITETDAQQRVTSAVQAAKLAVSSHDLEKACMPLISQATANLTSDIEVAELQRDEFKKDVVQLYVAAHGLLVREAVLQQKDQPIVSELVKKLNSYSKDCPDCSTQQFDVPGMGLMTPVQMGEALQTLQSRCDEPVSDGQPDQSYGPKTGEGVTAVSRTAQPPETPTATQPPESLTATYEATPDLDAPTTDCSTDCRKLSDDYRELSGRYSTLEQKASTLEQKAAACETALYDAKQAASQCGDEIVNKQCDEEIVNKHIGCYNDFVGVYTANKGIEDIIQILAWCLPAGEPGTFKGHTDFGDHIREATLMATVGMSDQEKSFYEEVIGWGVEKLREAYPNGDVLEREVVEIKKNGVMNDK